MYNYYDLDIIPIILSRFKVNHIIISGFDDKSVVNLIFKYCEDNGASYTAIDFKDGVNNEFIQDYTLNVLPSLRNYDAIFLNDDPNWYTVYNELNMINENNEEFPLVFICHNIFPHKRRDSYIDPEIIPKEFRNEFSKGFEYDNVFLQDKFYHAIEENTSKNGVLTAIEDFISENSSIGMMDIKLLNGITILYPINNISKIRLGKLSEEISGYDLEFDELSDTILENQILTNYISNLNISNENLEMIQDIKFELEKKEKIIEDYEEKIKIHDNELNYKNSQIETMDSKLSLKDAQIKNFESKLINSNNEVDFLNTRIQNSNNEITSLNNKLQDANNQITSLKNELDYNTHDFNNKEHNLNTKINDANSKIASLESSISQKEQLENDINNRLDIANNQIKKNIEEINSKDEYILIKEKELDDSKRVLNLIKKQYDAKLSKLDTKEYCISCYEDEIINNNLEIQYLKKDTLTRKIFSPLAYLYLILKSDTKELSLNFKLYKAMKNSKCFDIGFYLANNKDILESKWCKYFSPELHYVCNGFDENRKFNKKYFNRNSKKELLDYIINCP